MWSELRPDEVVVTSLPLHPEEDGRCKRHAVYVPQAHPQGIIYTEYRLATVEHPARRQVIAVRLGQMRMDGVRAKVADQEIAFITPEHFLDDDWAKAMRSADRRDAAHKLAWVLLLPPLLSLAVLSVSAAAAQRIVPSNGAMALALVATGVYCLLVACALRYAQRPAVVWTPPRAR